MSDLRLPSITAKNSETQVVQLKSYLYQLVEQLNYSLTLMEKTVTELETQFKTDLSDLSDVVDKNKGSLNNFASFIEQKFDVMEANSLLKTSIPSESGMWKLGGYRDPDTGEARFMWFEWE